MTTLRSGREEAVPYSLSRWTDVPDAKWSWLLASLKEGKMQAFDPRVGTPDWWSLRPEDTHSLIFWTKVPKNLVLDYDLLLDYQVKAHVTITGWEEVERGAPSISEAALYARRLSDYVGLENFTWRFSPVPLLKPDSVCERFDRIAGQLYGYTNRVFLSFLQENDRIPETRSLEDRQALLRRLAQIGDDHGIRVYLCSADETCTREILAHNLYPGVCVPPEGKVKPEAERCGCAIMVDPEAERCGCAIMVDPFTFNESCTMGCAYCYAADKTLSPRKSNTTRGLPVIR